MRNRPRSSDRGRFLLYPDGFGRATAGNQPGHAGVLMDDGGCPRGREDEMTHRTEPRTPQDQADAAAVLRRDRFGTLPERIRPQDTVETRPATRPDPARDTYNADEWLIRYCG
ncbi:hypothetical protein EASAB2608_06376 [Streptomyces sp. EAS-AB2608]|nr:hypothetical protein EASAB2608_06376 [Streptomyces sp. EAS-AB2608]